MKINTDCDWPSIISCLFVTNEAMTKASVFASARSVKKCFWVRKNSVLDSGDHFLSQQLLISPKFLLLLVWCRMTQQSDDALEIISVPLLKVKGPRSSIFLSHVVHLASWMCSSKTATCSYVIPVARCHYYCMYFRCITILPKIYLSYLTRLSCFQRERTTNPRKFVDFPARAGIFNSNASGSLL